MEENVSFVLSSFSNTNYTRTQPSLVAWPNFCALVAKLVKK